MTDAELDQRVLNMVTLGKRPTIGGLLSRLKKLEGIIEMDEYDQRKRLESCFLRLIREGKLVKSGLRLWIPGQQRSA